MVRSALAVASLVLVVAHAPAQPGWLEKRFPTDRAVAMVFDEARERTVMLDLRGVTWEWDGAHWTQATPSQSPSARGPMVYDTTRNRVVLFPVGTGEIWEWTGHDWELRATSTMPLPPKSQLAYDSARQRVVGVFDLGNSIRQTWEFDGESWRRFFSGPRPEYGPMAYDASRQRTVLYGEVSASSTWEWDGTGWTELVTGLPKPKDYTGLTYDPTVQRVLAVGGVGTVVGVDETWEWDGAAWTLVAQSGAGRAGSRKVVFDTARRRAVLYGGVEQGIHLADTREWDGSSWTTVDDSPRVTDAALVYDTLRQRSILMGVAARTRLPSTFDHWEWDGDDWTRLSVSTPPPRRFHSATFDTVRGRMVLFGGGTLSAVGVVNETWEWDGSVWTERFPATRPPARYFAAMAFHEARGRALLFGGENGPTFGDTWEWDGNDWTEKFTAGDPPRARTRTSMAYDPVRQRVVMFGGVGAGGFEDLLGDTWEWDGTNWHPRETPVAPSDRHGHTMAFDATRQRIVLFGGQSGANLLDDTWEWDGNVWTRLSEGGPRTEVYRYMVHDARLGHLVLVGVAPRASAFTGLWIHGDFPEATTQEYGAGCGAPVAPQLHAFGQPVFANPSYALDVHDALPSSPVAYLFSLGSGTFPLGGGCTVLVDPSLFIAQVGGVTSPTGFASLRLPIPADRALGGAEFYAQAALLAPAARIDLTGGLRTRVGE